jgi:effector-binding domain-containing protein
MKKHSYLLQGLLFAILLFVISCNNNQTEKKVTEPAKKDTPKVEEKELETKRGPVINIADTLSLKRIVLTMKDSAATMERVSLKLSAIYDVKLAAIIKKNNLKSTGSPMAWYKGEKAPYFFEAGIPVDKKPSKLPKGAFIKEMGVDSIVVAHFYGPYELIPTAYDALKDWMKDRKKKIKGAPYEIYVDDPLEADGKPKDPYKVRTDIVFAWK